MEKLISCLFNEEAKEKIGEALLQQQAEDLESFIEELALSVRRAKAEREKAPILRAMIQAWRGDKATLAAEAPGFIADYCDDLAQGVIADENPQREFAAFLEFFMESVGSISEAQHAALHRAYYEARFKELWRKAS